MSAAANTVTGDFETTMQAILEKQKKAQLADPYPSFELRKDRINRSIDLLKRYQNDICEAIAADFGHRSLDQSLLMDVAGAIGPLAHSRDHMKKWMKADKRKTSPAIMGLLGGRVRVEHQPKGVIGIISPWNFPIQLTFGPLANVFAAGNRSMIKPSEFTPATSELMARMISEAYDEDEVAVITGGPAVGEAFSNLAFDHLLFTGATSIARHVMKAASKNLVPLTLELGGKSPVMVSKSADMEVAAARIMNGKTLNAGQICLAPDYVMVPEGKQGEFVANAQKSVQAMYPTLKDNPDYTSIVNERHYDRLQSYLEDARAKGAEIVEINPANEDFSQQAHHKIPPTLVMNPTEDMKIMQEEIFGPLLPVKTYKEMDEAIDYVNDHERPLGLYYFGSDKAETNKVTTRTTSGGVTINDVIMHVAQEDAPFGGIGPAGMGNYHGEYGFREFTHQKTIFSQIKFEGVLKGMRPPYGESFRKLAGSMMKG